MNIVAVYVHIIHEYRSFVDVKCQAENEKHNGNYFRTRYDVYARYTRIHIPVYGCVYHPPRPPGPIFPCSISEPKGNFW